jgi:hypothetical protein
VTKTAADVLARIEALDDDFDLFASRKQRPTAERIAAAEERLGARLRDDHRALVEALGCCAVLAKESVWPRPRAFEVRPTWQLTFGIEIFGLAPNDAAPALDVVTQSQARAPRRVEPGGEARAARRAGARRAAPRVARDISG